MNPDDKMYFTIRDAVAAGIKAGLIQDECQLPERPVTRNEELKIAANKLAELLNSNEGTITQAVLVARAVKTIARLGGYTT